MKILLAPAVLSLSLLVCQPGAHAADYQGADAILKQVEAPTAAGTPAAPTKPDPVHQWREELKNYRGAGAALAPEEAARTWLDLFERAGKLPAARGGQSHGGSTPSYYVETFRALPPPSVWEPLAAQAAELPSPEKGSRNLTAPVLRVVSGTLLNKPEAVRLAIDEVRRQAGTLQMPWKATVEESAESLEGAFSTIHGDHPGILANFEAQLARLETVEKASPRGEIDRRKYTTLEIPHLVALADAARAEALLRRVFALPIRGVTIRDAGTKALARRVAANLGGDLKFAPWSLVNTLDASSLALYEAIRKRTHDDSGQWERNRAGVYYLLGLIAAGRYDEAASHAVERAGADAQNQREESYNNRLPEEALDDMVAKGYAKEVYHFFDRLLAAHPELPYRRNAAAAAVLAGETEAMLASVKAASERTDLPAKVTNELRHAYGDALLAADRVAEALPILRAWATSSQAAGDASKAVQAAAELARLGSVLGDDAMVGEQLDALVAASKSPKEPVTVLQGYGDQGLREIFLAAKRGPEAEQILAESLSLGERVAAENLARFSSNVPARNLQYYYNPVRGPLFALTDLYYRAGRFQDIIALLNHAKQWRAGDIMELLDLRQSAHSANDFGWQAARALQKTGDPAAALRVVNTFLESNGGSDPGYTLLLELLPPDQAEARLNALFQADQFEERPLIWRAILQLGQGRLDEAEKSVRQAIAIDPSDGEEGRGDRMRAYAVLGDILERKGDPEKARLMRQAVQAIRLSEDADRFHSAGLLTRAVGMYEKALGYFSDAYCIQSRLAMQLMALGKTEEAMTHYERAYELMPESFGRMESHCFGCERAFAGQRAQNTAERVFQRLAAAQPGNPRVHYLLAYLREEQGRDAEAAVEYLQAVKLDPDYINAWKRLAGTTEVPADRDQAELNLLRLDPRHRHETGNISEVNDLRALWTATEEAAKLAPAVVASVYPLAAGKVFLEQERARRLQKDGQAEQAVEMEMDDVYDDNSPPRTPAAVVLRNKVIARALGLLSVSGGGGPSL